MIARVIEPRPREVGGFTVERVLPSRIQRAVGPFVFFDHMGPLALAAGRGLDVGAHPHIGLATVTYLFAGELLHRDSLGSAQAIRPGAINWMTAGRGIAHSERTPAELRAQPSSAHALQLWVALPRADEELAPSFDHHPADTLPSLDVDGARLRVLAGSAFGKSAPVRTRSPLFYLDAQLPAGRTLALPPEFPERAAFLVEGTLACGSEPVAAHRMVVFEQGTTPLLRADSDARFVLLGGDPLDGERHLWWNFVSSSKERIEQAKADWQAGRFAPIPGDDGPLIPLPQYS